MKQPARNIKPYIISAAIGFMSATFVQQGRVDGYLDYVKRIQEQYSGCMAIGDYPTQADMLPGEGD